MMPDEKAVKDIIWSLVTDVVTYINMCDGDCLRQRLTTAPVSPADYDALLKRQEAEKK